MGSRKQGARSGSRGLGKGGGFSHEQALEGEQVRQQAGEAGGMWG